MVYVVNLVYYLRNHDGHQETKAKKQRHNRLQREPDIGEPAIDTEPEHIVVGGDGEEKASTQKGQP